MNVYLDTGVFIDYLSPQSIAGILLRSTNRRGRTPNQLFKDAEKLLETIAASHVGATSSLTYYEIEEALFKQLTSVATGMTSASTLRVLTARSIVPQTVTVARLFKIDVLDLTAATVETQLNLVDLHVRGIRAADALHIATAIHFEAEVLVSVDEDMLRLDGVITNRNGVPIKVCDTDEAMTML